MEKKIKACVYTRVSTDEQTKGFSLEEQERKGKAYIESKGWEYVGTYSDPGVSGRTMDRIGLTEMRRAILLREVDAVVIFKLDRLSRKQRDTMTLIEDVFLKYGAILASITETLDTSTEWGRAMIGILSSFNQMESETIQRRTSEGRKAKVAAGGYAGGKPPFGYKAVNGELVVVPEEAEIVRKVFELRDKGNTYRAIADALNEQGATTKTGKPFQFGGIRTILDNEQTYRGHYRYGDGTEVENQHEAILK